MEIYRVRAVVQPDGSLHIDDLPFLPGEEVEVIVQPQLRSQPASSHSSLEGTVLRYIDPTSPVDVEFSPELHPRDVRGTLPKLDTTVERDEDRV